MKNNLLKIMSVSISVMICMTGCAKKNKNEMIDELPEENPVIIEENTEIPFSEYSYEDFSNITVPITLTGENLPVEVHKLDITQFDFGERIPPCAAEKVRDTYWKSGYYAIEPEFREEYEREANERAETPKQGEILNCAVSGKYACFVVNYDGCENGQWNSHELSIFAYDLETEEMNEIYNYSDANDTEGVHVSNICIVGDYLYCGSYRNDYTLKLHIPTGETEKLDDDDRSIYDIFFRDGKIILLGWDKDWRTVSYEYSPETSENSMISAVPNEQEGAIFLDGSKAVMVLNENKKMDVITDNFKLNTNFRTGSPISCSNNTVTVLNGDLHMFSLDKMEHYIIKDHSLGQHIYTMNGNFIFCTGQQTAAYIYYLIPALGMAFKITDLGFYDNINMNENTVSFIEYSENIFGTEQYPINLCWFEY